MQRWEYLEIQIDSGIRVWRDSLGREGELREATGRWGSYRHGGALLNDLGDQGWELVGIEAVPSGSTVWQSRPEARWIFKRPRTPD